MEDCISDDAEVLSSACALPLPQIDDNLDEGDESDSDSLLQEDSEVEAYLVFDEITQICTLCDLVLEYPSHGPLCSDCHVFLYPDYTDQQRELDEERLRVERGQPRITGREQAGSSASDEGSTSRLDSTASDEELLGLALLSLYDQEWIKNSKFSTQKESVIEDDLVENMPTEILIMIFTYLDEIGHCKVSQVCRRWMILVRGMENWSVLLEKRWPIFRPVGVVNCWRKLYGRMIEATTCLSCFKQGFVKRIPVDDIVNDWRNKRLRSELKQLLVDPPHGIRACPVDDEYSHWQASIEGPSDTVYEDGIFYIHLELPRSYPMKPPMVRFLTRILHPNVNRHGNVGMDCLRHNWSLALTIPKILVSVQSLLTDPYCHLPMEPVVAKMYNKDREQFDMLARDWTRKFAMHHFQSDLSPWQD